MKYQATLCLSLIAAGLLSAASTQQDLQAVESVAGRLRAQRTQLGLSDRHAFAHKNTIVGSENTLVHRFHHTFRNLRVWGGESIVTTDGQGNLKGEPINSLRVAGDVDVEAVVPAAEAEAAALRADAQQGHRLFLRKPHSELLLYPIVKQVRVAGSEFKTNDQLVATDFEDVVERYALAYYVQSRMRSQEQSLIATDTIVDAKTGEVIAQWNALQNSAAKGTAKTLYSGDKQIDVNYTGSTYQLVDPTRTTNIQFQVSANGSSTAYTSTSGIFGNNTTSNTQTVAADAMYGVQTVYDVLKNCYNWQGRDNNNTGVYVKVHLAEDNAYFDGNQSLVLGDGVSQLNPVVLVDAVAHEFGHALCASTANLTYSGESGGLNEANSDIIGTLAEFYAKGGNTGTTVPLSGGDWVIGQGVLKSGNPLRWMYKPSLDSSSPDIWSSTLGNIDVHYSSGPANRMFYFLSQGSTASGDTYSSKLTYGPMSGIGIHKAGQIWMKAITTKMTASTKYSGAYTACKNAATELFGASSPEVTAVTRAFAAIAVTSDIQPNPALAISTQPTNQTVSAGSSVTFTVVATGGTPQYTYQWYRGTSPISSATGASYTFTTTTADNDATFKCVVTDSASATVTSSTATLTVTPLSALAISSQPASTTVTAGQTASFTVAATGGTSPYSYQWYRGTSPISGAVSATYSLTTATTDNGATFKCTVTDSAATPATLTSSSATLTVTPQTQGTEKILNGGFESGATSWAGTTGSIGNWDLYGEPAYEGTKCALLGGNGTTALEYVYQTVTIPSTATAALLSFYVHIDTTESGTTAYDTMAIQVRNSSGTLLKTLATLSNANAASGYVLKTYDLSAYKGKTIRVHFNMIEDAYMETTFVVDKVSLIVK